MVLVVRSRSWASRQRTRHARSASLRGIEAEPPVDRLGAVFHHRDSESRTRSLIEAAAVVRDLQMHTFFVLLHSHDDFRAARMLRRVRDRLLRDAVEMPGGRRLADEMIFQTTRDASSPTGREMFQRGRESVCVHVRDIQFEGEVAGLPGGGVNEPHEIVEFRGSRGCRRETLRHGLCAERRAKQKLAEIIVQLLPDAPSFPLSGFDESADKKFALREQSDDIVFFCWRLHEEIPFVSRAPRLMAASGEGKFQRWQMILTDDCRLIVPFAIPLSRSHRDLPLGPNLVVEKWITGPRPLLWSAAAERTFKLRRAASISPDENLTARKSMITHDALPPVRSGIPRACRRAFVQKLETMMVAVWGRHKLDGKALPLKSCRPDFPAIGDVPERGLRPTRTRHTRKTSGKR